MYFIKYASSSSVFLFELKIQTKQSINASVRFLLTAVPAAALPPVGHEHEKIVFFFLFLCNPSVKLCLCLATFFHISVLRRQSACSSFDLRAGASEALASWHIVTPTSEKYQRPNAPLHHGYCILNAQNKLSAEQVQQHKLRFHGHENCTKTMWRKKKYKKKHTH